MFEGRGRGRRKGDGIVVGFVLALLCGGVRTVERPVFSCGFLWSGLVERGWLNTRRFFCFFFCSSSFLRRDDGGATNESWCW